MTPREDPVDLNRLKEFTDGTSTSLRELVDLYLAQTGQHVREISAAVQARELERARKMAHSSAGSSGTCGMRRLSTLLRELENAAQANDSEQCSVMARQAEEEFARVEAFLKEVVA
jgi:HPt (histidine-containing phosphotransfer) domain-containing protein